MPGHPPSRAEVIRDSGPPRITTTAICAAAASKAVSSWTDSRYVLRRYRIPSVAFVPATNQRLRNFFEDLGDDEWTPAGAGDYNSRTPEVSENEDGLYNLSKRGQRILALLSSLRPSRGTRGHLPLRSPDALSFARTPSLARRSDPIAGPKRSSRSRRASHGHLELTMDRNPFSSYYCISIVGLRWH